MPRPAAASGACQTKAGRRMDLRINPPPRNWRRSPPGGRLCVLPTSRPPRGNIPVDLIGCCYNCGSEKHISAMCTGPPLSVRCGEKGHISRGCTRPRPRCFSPGENRAPPSLRPVLPPPPARTSPPPPPPPARSPPQGLPPLPPGPPPAHAVCVAEPCVSVRSAAPAASIVGPTFSVSFASVTSQRGAEEIVDCCSLETGADLRALEEELGRNVVVTFVGRRPAVDLDALAAQAAQILNPAILP